MAGVRERRRVLAFDNRGTGLSAKPPGPYSIEQLADDAASVLDARGLERADVYGHSMGGFIALTLALRRPELVRSLVLVGTGPGGPDHEPLPPETLDVWFSVVGLPPEEAIRRTLPDVVHAGLARRASRRVRGVAGRAARPADAARVLAGAVRRQPCATSTSASRWSGSRVPALVVHGELDRVIPVANGRLLAERMPGAELVVLPEQAHVPMLEQPAAFAELVCAFLDRLGD